jgi:hypothetical protein
MTPIRAIIVGPSSSTTSISASIAACHSGVAASFLGSAVMKPAASRKVTSFARPATRSARQTRGSSLMKVLTFPRPEISNLSGRGEARGALNPR